MDLWVFGAAAATAGYVAKYCRNISRGKDGSSKLSSGANIYGKLETPSCPLRRLARGNKLSENTSTNEGNILDGRFSDVNELHSISEAEVVSTSGYDGNLENVENYEDYHVLSFMSLQCGIVTHAKLRENDPRNGLSSDADAVEELGNSFSGEAQFSHMLRNRSSTGVKCSYDQLVKPRNSVESCLMSQIYKEHMKMEEYMVRSLPPSSTNVCPLLISDGFRVISRAKIDPFHAQTGSNDTQADKAEKVCGISPLPKLNTLKKLKLNTQNQCDERLNSSQKFVRGSRVHSLTGSLDGTTLFCLGVSIGLISSFIANRREVGKLKELLKQTENLVQDLQEDLEMRDALTFKELVNENHNSKDTSDNSFYINLPSQHFSVGTVDNSTVIHGKESYDEKLEESSESMRKIEAELEAELERLGLNMNSSCLERRLSDLVELDPDFVADFAHGELRADKVKGHDVPQDEIDQDGTDTSTTHSANYVVSPRELSLRLHEVIHSRLEERVKELESALERSHRKVQLMESKDRNTWGKLSSSEIGFSSDQESPVAEGDWNSNINPLDTKISREAVDAYNEACDEFREMDETDEELSLPGDYGNSYQVTVNPFHQTLLKGQINGANYSLSSHMHCQAQCPQDEEHESHQKTSLGHPLKIQRFVYCGVSEDDSNDEMEKQLIKKIVEKTRAGSPVVLNAQRVLSTMDENEK
ncbi:hypothetical protein K2173_028313 [Erythroxylum novogranatense]|uniref:Uncharacterized protein n=1 Tax=Erythroxylum novogranatense TaxID=1862640 RepID=A0AAV8U1I1_9ROSI|nr:hypothetical protein K2173_028313 [Erythroxylum novogranatense]